MDEYFWGRKRISISKLDDTQIFANKVFVNERPDKKFQKNNLQVNNCTFATMGFKGSKIDQSAFLFCTFIDCYFKYTTFEHINFTGCKFINCNFDESKFVACDFSYTSFKDCIIDYEVLHYNLPSVHNLRWKLCTNLSLESLKLGNDAQYRQYFFEEKRSSEKHYLSMFIKKDSYYKGHYSAWESFVGLMKFVGSKINKYLWGYGEKISYLIFNICFVIMFFTIVYLLSGPIFKVNGASYPNSLNFIESLYVSLCNFTTITSDFTSSNATLRGITAIEGFIGITLMGFFVAALFRYINRR